MSSAPVTVAQASAREVLPVPGSPSSKSGRLIAVARNRTVDNPSLGRYPVSRGPLPSLAGPRVAAVDTARLPPPSSLALHVVVLAASQITTFHTMSAVACEITVGSAVSRQGCHDRFQMIAAEEHRVAWSAVVGDAGQGRGAWRR